MIIKIMSRFYPGTLKKCFFYTVEGTLKRFHTGTLNHLKPGTSLLISV
jgi:hypothetical protein